MNYRQKLGYTILGSVIMLIGMSVSSILSPPSVAQNNGVFDEIQCNKLTVVNKAGRPAILLASTEGEMNFIGISNPVGEPASILYSSGKENGLSIHNQAGTLTVNARSTEQGGDIRLFNEEEKPAIALLGGLTSNESGNGIILYNQVGDNAAFLQGNKHGGTISTYNHIGKKTVSLGSTDTGSHLALLGEEEKMGIVLAVASELARILTVYNEEGKKVIQMGTNNRTGDSDMTIYDRAGNTQWTAP